MQSPKGKKIDLNVEYPCPCRRQGRLQPIVLTEAFGCDRCQQIFVVEDKGYLLEQVSSTYPYKRGWRWLGNRWTLSQSRFRQTYLPVVLILLVALLIIWLPLALRSPSNTNVLMWALVAVLLAVLPALMVWLTYRR